MTHRALLLSLVMLGCGARTGLESPSSSRMDGGMIDGGMDAPADTPDVAFLDVPFDGGSDAPIDGGTDAPIDGGTDAPDATLLPLLGCADGEREGFLDRIRHARIAGCSGGFSVPGLLVESPSRCSRAGGDDGSNPNGIGCSATDLCAEGWHVCRGADEVMTVSPGGCDGVAGGEPAFFATRQSGPGCGICTRSGTRTCGLGECSTECRPDPTPGSLMANDLFGCGTLGDLPDGNCAPLDRFSNNLCGATTAPWSCPGSTGFDEALVVQKNGPERGGVLCCRD